MELLHIYSGSAAPLALDNLSLPTEGYVWLVLERSELSSLSQFLKQIDRRLNLRHVEDIQQINHPSFFDGVKDYDVVIFRSLSNRKNEIDRRIFNSTAFIAYKDILITVYDHANPIIPECLKLFISENRLPPDDPANLIQFCLEQFIKQFLDTKQGIDNKLTLWQKKLIENRKRSSQDWAGLLDFKTDLRRIRILCEEQLETINNWQMNVRSVTHASPQHNEQLQVNLTDSASHTSRMVKLITQSQQELDALLQLYFTILSQRTNEVMRILALVTGIFLPANLITGIYGMNFSNIPDLSQPHGFVYAVGSMILISTSVLAIFRWRKWL